MRAILPRTFDTPLPIDAVLDELGAHARGQQRRRAGGAARRRQDDAGAAGAARCALAEGPEDHHAGAAPDRGARQRRAHGADARRTRRRDRRLSRPLRLEDLARDPHRGRHRGHLLAADSRRSRTVRRRRRAVRRISRALARCRSRPGAGARRADRLARGSAHSRDVGDARRRAGRQAARRCAGHRQRRPRLSGRDALSRPQGRCAARAADGGCDRDGAARRSRLGAGVPAGAARNPPHRRIFSRERVHDASIEIVPLFGALDARRAGPRHRAGAEGPAQGRAGDLDRRDLADHRGRAHRRRFRPGAGAALRAGYRPDPAGDRARLARRGRSAPRPRRPHRARRLLPAVGRAADRFARRLHPAGNPFRRSVLAGARSRAMGRARSRDAGVSRSAAGAGAEGGATACSTNSARSMPTAGSPRKARACARWRCRRGWRA